MANDFYRLNLTGIGRWFRLQHDEERGHALKLIDDFTDRNGIVKIKSTPERRFISGMRKKLFQKVLNMSNM
ncbi:ferritin-like domain-containing protein [Bacillus swezeyi]|uniref:ferritin-like domain-containing protein n=1 Tax=Bacillus swezeyi TaxID=1925020 RepID=UPI00399C6E60